MRVKRQLSKANKRRIWIYGGILFLLVGGYFYQPIRIDFLAKPVPNPNPSVDPDFSDLIKSGAKITVITAHPDDAEFYLGPLLMRLAKSHAIIDLIVCTDGDKSFYLWENGEENRRVRRSEQIEASKMWHANSVYFLGFPDGRLQPKPDVVAAIKTQLQRTQPTWVLAFDGDYPPHVSHGDHRSSGQAAQIAVDELAIQGSTAKWLLRFATHAPNFRLDVTDTQDQAKTLLAFHKSQFAGQKLEFVTNKVTDDAVNEAESTNYTYAVALRCSRNHSDHQ